MSSLIGLRWRGLGSNEPLNRVENPRKRLASPFLPIVGEGRVQFVQQRESRLTSRIQVHESVNGRVQP